MTEQPHDPEVPSRVSKRRLSPLVPLGILAAVGLSVTAYFVVTGHNRVSTDDAYVDGNLVGLTPQIGGTVVAINADQTQFVRQGQVLVQLDPHDNDVALGQAEANLAQTVRTVAQLFADERRDEAAVGVQEAALTQAQQDLARDRSLADVHGVSAETLQHDEDAVNSARAALAQAQATSAATRAAVAGTTPDSHPQVQQAEANLRSAWLAAARTKVLSPVSGYVVRRSVQVGQQVTTGTELLAVVPLDSVWIDANFKENELRDLRIGQPVNVSADIYGSRIEYHGRVLGLAAGTGSALAVLPAQNATGNWIKIVQRLPVRIGLDPEELRQHPLFLGLSTTVTVDVANRSGSVLSQQPVWKPSLNTEVYAAQVAGVEEVIRNIVSRNLGRFTTRAETGTL